MIAQLGSFDDVAVVLQRSKQTVYGMTSSKRFPEGVYLGHGRFNLIKLQKHIDDGTLFKPCVQQRHGNLLDTKGHIRQFQQEMQTAISRS
jgi:hypothetical protein